MNQKNLKWGYTTGSCAAAAAKGAVTLLLLGQKLQKTSLLTPKGITLQLDFINCSWKGEKTICGVKKDSGDDPDVTNGIVIYATAEKIEKGIIIEGGEGIGRVTKKGLQQPVGAAAINKVPREMIKKCIEEISALAQYHGGIAVTIWTPQGKEIAKKTYNSRLGILGGISILGTSGIVEPMSERALLDSIIVELGMKAANSNQNLILTPGNYGRAFLKKEYGIDVEKAVKISNFVGETLDAAKQLSLHAILLVGHIGKLVKIAGGIMQTHSKYADCRMEIIGVHGAMAGADTKTIQSIMQCITTEEALLLLKEKGLLEKTMDSILKKMLEHMQYRLGEKTKIEVIVFSEKLGVLAQTKNVEAFLKNWRQQ
ncbi:MAG TPA: cobalamin biosynthesis protein CbiD [Candidatus Coprocola pullicola]|nr:cobalamin biosynthesis protein CbiD [Candidatus Coprocola pullicola]